MDFTKFPTPEKTSRNSASAVNLSFSLPLEDASTVKKIAEGFEQELARQGWQPAPQAGQEVRNDDVQCRYYRKQDILLMASIGTSRGFQAGTQDVNAGLFLIGQMDLRSLPAFPGSKTDSATCSALKQTSSAKIGDVRKFHTDTFAGLGWTEYRRPEIPGSERSAEEMDTEQSFLRNGTSVSFIYRQEGGSLVWFSRAEVMGQELPLPPNSSGVQLDVSTPYLFYTTPLTTEEIFAFYEKALAPQGWKGVAAPKPDGGISKYFLFSAEGRKDWSLSCLKDGAKTHVEFRTAK